jgi:hypothetical protein
MAILGRPILEENTEDVLVRVLPSEEFETNKDTVQAHKTKCIFPCISSQLVKSGEGTDERRCPPTRR